MERFILRLRVFLFMLLSVCDLVLTWWLLRHSGRVVCEANPVADWWLSRFGWCGLAAFKIGMMVLIMVLLRLVSQHRPRAAGHVLSFACAVLAAVVVHSAALGRSAPTEDEWIAQSNRDLEEYNRQAHQRATEKIAYAALLDSICEDLVEGKCTLPEAVAGVMRSRRSQDHAWQRALATVYAGRSVEESVARNLLHLVNLAGATSNTARQLQAQCEALYGAGVQQEKTAGAGAAFSTPETACAQVLLPASSGIGLPSGKMGIVRPVGSVMVVFSKSMPKCE
jgi:uncharacterized protein DUF5658